MFVCSQLKNKYSVCPRRFCQKQQRQNLRARIILSVFSCKSKSGEGREMWAPLAPQEVTACLSAFPLLWSIFAPARANEMSLTPAVSVTGRSLRSAQGLENRN